MLNSFSKIVQNRLASLPKNDYPVLNTRLFMSICLSYAMDKSLTSMRDIFKRLNGTGYELDISTFSKANASRSQEPFLRFHQQLNEEICRQKSLQKYELCPIDSTVITLTSKLLWLQEYYQVKLVSSLNLTTGVPEENLINFGYDSDYRYGKEMLASLPPNGVGVMDRGFSSLKFLRLAQQSNKYFVLRIPNNYKLQISENKGQFLVGTGKDSGIYRVVNFCDLEKRAEYRLATNLERAEVSDEELMEIYKYRWHIELLWKFLKMHLKLDKLITKNVNGIAIQIYVSLIAYLILKIVDIPEEWGTTLLDKLRYLQCCMCQEISYVHWIERLLSG
ncbi:IS4 family transposase [Kamptonema formosum]|uniref:IS4 family transposase n=1 Tax=Kamptonema formosum TaxID=331992 RepID=UPI00034C3B0E|nr:IS4 family transposase [Oscillatoria sp. PCC 10802]